MSSLAVRYDAAEQVTGARVYTSSEASRHGARAPIRSSEGAKVLRFPRQHASQVPVAMATPEARLDEALSREYAEWAEESRALAEESWEASRLDWPKY